MAFSECPNFTFRMSRKYVRRFLDFQILGPMDFWIFRLMNSWMTWILIFEVALA